MRISVVIPAFKARNYLAESLASIEVQTRKPDEVVIVDDASPEPIDDIIGSFHTKDTMPPVQLVRHGRNQGLGATRNTGIREASGDWIALLDHDDLWLPGHLEGLVEAIDSSGADLAFSTAEIFVVEEGEPQVTGEWGPDSDEWTGNPAWSLFCKSFIQPSATLIRRSTLMDLGGFDTDPRIHMCEDLDLWLRLVKEGGCIAHSNGRTLRYRQHPGGATSRRAYMSRQNAFVRAKHVDWIPAPWRAKRRLMARTFWQAALQVRAARRDDQFEALRDAIRHGLWFPPQTVAKLVRWCLTPAAPGAC